MRIGAVATTVVFLSLWTASAAADEPAAGPGVRAPTSDSEAYCAWAKASAASEAAPLLAPGLFVSGGVVGGVEEVDGATPLPPTGRVTAGARYGVSGLVRGIAIHDRAAAACELYRAESVLRAFVQTYRDGESRAALTALVAVYEDALPRGVELTERLQAAAASGRATAIEVTEAQLRLDDMRARVVAARERLEAMARRTPPSAAAVAEARRTQPERESELERKEARIRRTAAWDVDLRGGYDQFFGVRSHVPLFAVATLTVNVGMIAQPSAEDRALQARQLLAERQIEGPVDRADQTIARLTAARSAARARIATTAALASDLEQRWRTLESVPTDGAKLVANVVWFALVHAKAEHAYQKALALELDNALRGVTR